MENNRKPYCSRLTKEQLICSGITDVTTNGQVWRNGKLDRPANFKNAKKNYELYWLYELDEDGNKIKIYLPEKGPSYYVYKITLVGYHRMLWAWTYGEVPEGYTVDHKNNDDTDNRITNLQLLTPAENLEKDRPEAKYRARMAIKKIYTEDYILEKINYHTARIIELRKIRTVENRAEINEQIHKIRSSIARWKNRLKQFRGLLK